MLADIDPTLYSTLQRELSTYFFHTKCLVEDLFKAGGPLQAMRVVAKSTDFDGLDYVAAVEHRQYPFYGLQFHPEKLQYEWNPSGAVMRPQSGIRLSHHLADFFFSEAAKNNHRFKNPGEFYKRQIENYESFHSMLTEDTALQSYYIIDDDTYDIPTRDLTWFVRDAKFGILNSYITFTGSMF